MAWLSGFTFRRKITILNNGADAINNADVLITLDTASLIAGGKMQSNGNDIRFYDNTALISYSFWVESCWNTSTTDIWVRVPSLPVGTTIIYMYYGNNSASQGAGWQTYTGNTIYMFSGSVPSGYGSHNSFLGKSPRCASWYSGSYTTSGSATHTHTLTGNVDATGDNINDAGGLDGAGSYYTHTHTTSSPSITSTVYPNIALVFFSGSTPRLTNDGGLLPQGTILFYSGSSSPSNWSQYTPLNNLIPSGSSGTCTVSATLHTHTFSATLTTGSSGRVITSPSTAVATASHTHTLNSTGSNAQVYPSYITMYSVSANSATPLPTNIVVMFTVLPPYGWRQTSEGNLRWPMGSGSYGGLGGGGTHTHVVTTGVPSASTSSSLYTQYCSTATHTHTITSGAESIIPPYIDVIYAVKTYNSALTITLGSEEGATTTAPTRGYTPYVPAYANIFMFVETPRWASTNVTEWELRLNAGNRYSSYKTVLADPNNEWRGKLKGLDPIRCWVNDGPRFDMLMWGIVEDHSRLKQDTSTLTITGRNFGALESYRNWPYNWYETDTQTMLLYGDTPLSGSVPEIVYGVKIGNPQKTLTVRAEKRKVSDVWTEIATRCSDGNNNWIHNCCMGEHIDERHQPNKHFELQQDIPSEVFLTPTDVMAYEQLVTIRPCVQKIQVEYAQGIVSGSAVWRNSGSIWTDLTVEAGTRLGTPFTILPVETSGSDSLVPSKLYIGSDNRFWKLWVDLSGSGIYTGSGGTGSLGWQYSKYGTGSSSSGSWGYLDVVDETYGYAIDGSISFNIPVDWSTGSIRTGSLAPTNYGITATGSASGSQQGFLKASKITNLTAPSLSIQSISFYAHNTGSARLAIFDDSGVASGENDANTVLLFHYDGASGSTTFVDTSFDGANSPHTITTYGGAIIDTSQSMFGGASGYFNGTNSYLSGSDSADWFFSTGDFTIDFWVRFDSLVAFRSFYSQYVDGNNELRLYWSTDNNLRFQNYTLGSATINMSGSWTPSTNTWYHVAIARSSSSWYMFVNGSQIGSTYTNSNAVTDFAAGITIGMSDAGAYYHNGRLDEFRVSKGVARWTSNFTSPTRAYQRSYPRNKLWESNSFTLTTGSSSTGSINTANISAGTPSTLTLNSGNCWLAWQVTTGSGTLNAIPSYTLQYESGSYGTQTFGNFPSIWPSGSTQTYPTGSNEAYTEYLTNQYVEYYTPWYYWVRQTGSNKSVAAATAYQYLFASLSPSITRTTGSANQWGVSAHQYEYVYRGDLTDSGSAITYADTVLAQLSNPIRVLRCVMRGSTYWRPTYTFYWRGPDYTGSGRYRLSSVIHRRSLEGYSTTLEAAAI